MATHQLSINSEGIAAKIEKSHSLQTLDVNDSEQQEECSPLQYLTDKEKQAVDEAFGSDSRLIDRIVSQIAQGEWMELFQSSLKDPSQLSYLFIVAYKQRKIDLEDLATAMIFHRAFCNTQRGQCHIVPISREILDTMVNLTAKSKRKILEKTKDVKNNQKFMILVDRKAVDEYTTTLIKATFKNGIENEVKGYLHQCTGDVERFGTFSFGLCHSFYPELSPVIHLTPSIETMADHTKIGISDFALFFPEEDSITHGSTDKTIFAPVHDLLHTEARRAVGDLYVATLNRVAHVKVDPSERTAYAEKQRSVGRPYPFFHRYARGDRTPLITWKGVENFLVDRILGEVVDASYEPDLESTEDVLRYVAKSVFEREINNLPIFDPRNPEDMRQWTNTRQRVLERFGIGE